MAASLHRKALRLVESIDYQIRAYMKLMAEGFAFNDKLVILIYMLWAPIRLIRKIFRRPIRHQYMSDVKIKNADGVFQCGRSFISSRNVCTATEKDLRGLFEMGHGNFVDVGAHIGKYTIPLGRKLGSLGKVIAVEPDPTNFGLLSENVALNGLNNVLLQNIACSKNESEAIFYINEDCPTLNSTYFQTGSKKIMVKTLKLDTLISRLGIEHIRLIKIDVEGAETEVIEGSQFTLQKSHPKLIFEVYNKDHLGQIERILGYYDYKIRKVSDKDYLAI